MILCEEIPFIEWGNLRSLRKPVAVPYHFASVFLVIIIIIIKISAISNNILVYIVVPYKKKCTKRGAKHTDK